MSLFSLIYSASPCTPAFLFAPLQKDLCATPTVTDFVKQVAQDLQQGTALLADASAISSKMEVANNEFRRGKCVWLSMLTNIVVTTSSKKETK